MNIQATEVKKVWETPKVVEISKTKILGALLTGGDLVVIGTAT